MLHKLYVTCGVNINAAVRAETRRQTRLLLRRSVDAYSQLGKISSRRRVNNHARAVDKRAGGDSGGERQRAAVGTTMREKRERGGRGLRCSGRELKSGRRKSL